ncbi:hypothetical protein [Absidia glauca]|uniref:Phospholipase n=1 Tax=Absidia glauca TaxID=4829 RepID=A0A168L2P0_ABSGL|nr:hypothetical protein [Absidia glauca]
MSNPITANVEYFMNRDNEQDWQSSTRDASDANHHFMEDPTHLAKRWHSLMRRMSATIQREEGTPEGAIRSGTPHQPTDHERQLMLALPLPPPMDDHLPSIEEVARENALAIKLAEMKPSYFEHPFEQVDSDISDFEAPLGAEALPTPPQQEDRPFGVKQKIFNSFGSQRRSSTAAPHMWTKYPLAPFYPPVYVVPHIAFFSRDEHGRRAPPILFDILQVAIVHSEMDPRRLWIFRIELYYGEIRWVIHRTIIEFYNLHLTLKFKAATALGGYMPPPSFPSQLAHLYNAALTSMRLTWTGAEEDGEEEDTTEDTIKRRAALEQYLKDLVYVSRLAVNYDLCEFLELSAVSIVKDMGWKGKEGYLEHKLNPTAAIRLSSAFRWMNHWTKKWILLRDSYIALCKDIGSSAPSEVLLFDRHLKILRGHGTFAPYHQTHLTISNGTRRIEIKGSTHRQMDEWMECLDVIRNQSPWVRNHRFGSFAPMRLNAKAKWFVDSHEYFEAVAEALLSAKSEIYIEDWWLSPELYLRRPPKGNEDYRLDRLLKRKAMEGVMIYIVVYKNVPVALPLDSQHTRDWLQNIHKNIKVLRHSDMTSPLWAHHEPVRHFYTFTHRSFVWRLSRNLPWSRLLQPADQGLYQSQYNMEVIDKQSAPRMPWHDIHTAMVGPPARDVARHFIQRWNYIKSTHAKDKDDIPLLLPKGEYVASKDEEKFRGSCRVQVVRSSAEWSLGIKREVSIKYSIYNAYMECISRAKHFIYIENQFFITATRSGDKLIKNKIGEALVARIKRAHQEKQKFRVIVVIPTAPGFEGDFAFADRRSMALRSIAHYQYLSISRGGNSVLEKLHQANIPAEQYIGFYSLRNWGQIKKPTTSPESSDLQSATNGSMDDNRRNGSIRSNNKTRIAKIRTSVGSLTRSVNDDDTSQQQQQPRSNSDEQWDASNDGRMDFVTEQVYIHSKLMIVDDKTVICGSANLNDRSQLGNRDSEIAVVIEDTDLVDSQMNGQTYQAARFALTLRMHLFKEHLGLLLQPDADPKVLDPLSDSFLNRIWHQTAETNTLTYRFLFHCVPDDTVLTFENHRRFVPSGAPGHIANPQRMTYQDIVQQLASIRGHLVHFPTQYLCQENMTSSLVQEAVPPTVFT